MSPVTLRIATLSISILAALSALRLLIDGLSELDRTLPFVAFCALMVITFVAQHRLVWGRYSKILSTLGVSVWLHVVWFGVAVIGWYVLASYALQLLQLLFPLLVLLTLNLLFLVGLSKPETFQLPLRLYFGVGVGIGFALLLLEILLRVYSFPPSSAIGAQLNVVDNLQTNENFGHIYRPNASFVWTNTAAEFETDIQINNLGFHDEDRALESDALRILVLGDSFTEALQVPLTQTPTQVAQTCLRDATDRPVEVINGGISANGTGHRWLFYQHEGVKLQPDVVIFAHYPVNDIWDNLGELGTVGQSYYRFSLSPQGEIIPEYITPKRDLIDYFADGLNLRTFAVLRAIRINQDLQQAARLQVPDTRLFDPTLPDNIPQAWAINTALLRQFSQDVLADGALFGVMLIPNWAMLEPDRLEVATSDLDFDILHAELEQVLQADDIPVLNLKNNVDAYYNTIPDDTSLYWEHDAHFNADGYALMGETLCEWILEQGFIDGE